LSFLDHITPIITTLDEEANIARTLRPLEWAREVIVVDSDSTDSTCAIASAFPNVRIVCRPFISHAEQWAFAVAKAGVRTEWVLTLDADYVLTTAGTSEIQSLDPSSAVAGYSCRFQYWALGRPLRGSLYPPRIVLARKDCVRFHQDGHAHRLTVGGEVRSLRSPMIHDDRKPTATWLANQWRYAQLEATKLLGPRTRRSRLIDALRRLGLSSPLAFLRAWLGGGGWLDGRAGFYYAVQRAVAEGVIALAILERLDADREASGDK
jgi:hypothetical protein